jgi:hypothetical protein
MVWRERPNVMSDLETVPGVTSAALRRDSDGELAFTVGSAVQVIEACTRSGIAVLGVEVFPGLNLSTYDLHLKDPADEKDWPNYVRTNNALAEDFLRTNPAPGTNECVLTTASWRELYESMRAREAMRKQELR